MPMEKKASLIIAFTVLLFVALSCEKVANDKIPPTIILKGSNPDTLLLGCTYEEPGYILRDDNSVPDMYIENNLPTDSAGVFYIRYTAIDADSNRAYASRKIVLVARSADSYLGTFTAYDTIAPLGDAQAPFTVQMQFANQSDTLFSMKNFNNFGDDFSVDIAYSDSTGIFTINHNLNDTLVEGSGFPYCNNRGFRIVYSVVVPGHDRQYHRTTFRK